MGAELLRLEEATKALVPSGAYMKTIVNHVGERWRVGVEHLHLGVFVTVVHGNGRTFDDALAAAWADLDNKRPVQDCDSERILS